MRHFFKSLANAKASSPSKAQNTGFLKASFKAVGALMLIQSVAFGADFLFVSTADKDWLPTNDKALANSNTITLPYGKNKAKNFIMDIGGGGLGYGSTQKYTLALQIDDDGSEKVDDKGYYEVIVDMNLAKSILKSDVGGDEEITNYFKEKKVTPPSVYGKYENKGINFFLRSQNNGKGINYGKCEIKNSDDSTLKQFKIIIPKKTNSHQLVIQTDDKMIDCAKSATTGDKKSYFYGIRMSIKHENKAFIGVDSTGSMIGTNYQTSDGKNTYNLPTLIIAREDTLPSYCTPAMINNKSYACKKEADGTGVDKSGDKKALLWAACGESDILDEMDCRKDGAKCENRIVTGDYNNPFSKKANETHNVASNDNEYLKDGKGNSHYNYQVQDGGIGLHGYCWEDYDRKSTIYADGYYFERWQWIDNNGGGCARAGDCYVVPAWNDNFCRYKHYVKAPKIFTLSLREYANRWKDEIDHQNLPNFEAKFRIVNASTGKGDKEKGLRYYKQVRKSFFKNNEIKCGKAGQAKNVTVKLEGGEYEPTFTIKSESFSDLKGKNIECEFALSGFDGSPGSYGWPDFENKGLYMSFAYNIQLASLKIVNTPNSTYKDLSLNTKCGFASKWNSGPGMPSDGTFLDDVPGRTTEGGKRFITWEKFNYSSSLTKNAKSAQRHFRFDARPLFYVAKELPNLDQNELYAGYKYHENTNLNQNASNLKFLYDKKENEKLIDTAIKFPRNYTGNKVEKIQIIGARDAENKEIIMNTFDSVKLKGTMASIYARDDELETSNHKDSKINNIFYTSSTNFMSGSTTIGSSWIKNCFTNNICRSVWGDLVKDRVDLSGVTADGNAKQLTFSAFIYTDLYEGNKYLTYDNAGKTMLALRDSDFTGFSQTNKTTHSDHPEPLCEVGEVRAIYLTPLNDKTQTGTGDYTKFRTEGKGLKDDENNAVYGCDIPVVTNPELKNFAEYKTFKFYTFNPAMIKINSAAAGKAIGTSLYHSQKFIYNRGKCSNYPTYPEIACRDDIENPAFKIQVGAVGLTRADIEANNFLTRYDGTAVSSDDVSIRGSVLEPIIVHQGRDTTKSNNTKSITEEFNFKIKNQDLENLYLAPRCVSEFSIRQGGMVLNCKSGDKVDENNYIAKGTNNKIVDLSNAEVSAYGKMHNEQTHWQNLVNKKGEADITIFKSGFINGVAELDNVKREDKKEPDSQGLIFGKGGQSNYSLLKPSDPIIPENMLEEVEVPVDAKTNKWIETPKGMSVMSDSFGAATVLDVTLIAPNKQVGINKDNAVFLAAYISKPELVKKLQNKAIIGEIIPGYANYYRIRRDAFGNNLKDKFFTYSNVEFIEPVKDNKNDGDFLRIADVEKEATATLIPSADGDKSYILYCNFIRNCYPLGDGTYGAKFRGFANKETNWSKDNGQGSTILDKARTRPTQKRIAW